MKREENESDLERLRYIDSILDRPTIGEPAKDGELFAYSIKILLLELQTYLGELSARSLRDPEAAKSLWTFANTVCRDLWEVCERKPDVIRHFAAKRMFFPINWPLLKEDQKQIFEKIKSLGIGTDGIYRLPAGKQFDPKKPVNKLVLFHVDRILKLQYEMQSEFARHHALAELSGEISVPPVEIYVRDKSACIKDPWLKQVMSLARLSRANADEWAKTIWQKILQTHGGKGYDLLWNASKLESLGRVREALGAYQQVVDMYPHTLAADDAKLRIEHLRAEVDVETQPDKNQEQVKLSDAKSKTLNKGKAMKPTPAMRIIKWAAVVFVASCLIPPWQFTADRNGNGGFHSRKSAGYSVLIFPPTNPDRNAWSGVQIDFGRLLLEWAALAAVTGMVWVLVAKPAWPHDDKANHPEKFTPPTGNPEN